MKLWNIVHLLLYNNEPIIGDNISNLTERNQITAKFIYLLLN